MCTQYYSHLLMCLFCSIYSVTLWSENATHMPHLSPHQLNIICYVQSSLFQAKQDSLLQTLRLNNYFVMNPLMWTTELTPYYLILFLCCCSCFMFYAWFQWIHLLSAKNMLRRQALESGRVGRKPYVEQSRQPPGSKNRRPPQPSQVRTCMQLPCGKEEWE